MPEKQIVLPYQWCPRPYQEGLWSYLYNGGKRAVARWHRRSGKDDLFLHFTAVASHRRIGNYWYLLPEYAQARKSMWDAINGNTGKRRIDEVFPHEIRQSTRDQEMMIRFHCGSTFQLVGSDNFNSLVGSPPVGLVFSEYALSNPSAWAYLMPIVEENGGWAGFNSTPRGANHFKGMCELADSEPDWFYQALTADDTDVFTDKQLLDILKQMQATHGDEFGKALWLQEYYVSFDAAVMGSIWGDCVTLLEARNRVGDVPHTPNYLVHTAWDLGYEDATSVWFFQMVGNDIHVIDCHESNHKSIEFYGEMLRQKAKERGFEYGTHHIPHDARPRTLAAGGKTILQQFIEQDVGKFQIVARVDKQEGIQAARATFPHCKFDLKHCEDGLEALKYYHREWDDEKKTFGLAPEHDWSSHFADSWRYLSLSWKFHAQKRPETGLVEGLKKGSIQNITFGALKNAFFRKKKQERARLQ